MPRVHRVRHNLSELVSGTWLTDESEYAAIVDRFDRRAKRGLTRQQDAHRIGIVFCQDAQQLRSASALHVFVGYDDVHFAFLQDAYRFQSGAREEYPVGFVTEYETQARQNVWLVVH